MRTRCYCPYRLRESAQLAPCGGCGKLTSRGYCNRICERESIARLHRLRLQELDVDRPCAHGRVVHADCAVCFRALSQADEAVARRADERSAGVAAVDREGAALPLAMVERS